MSFWEYILSYGMIVGILPCIIGAIRVAHIERRYLPFLLFVWCSFFNDSISYYTGKYLRTNAPNTDIYFLVEALLILLMYRRWGLFKKSRIPLVLTILYSVFWVWETLIYRSLFEFNSFSHVGFAFVSVLLSIQYINKLILTEQKLDFTNGEFLIAITLVFYSTAAVISEIFWFYGFGSKNWLANRVQLIMSYTNTVSYLIFAFALLCIPRKQRFLQLS